MNRKLFWKLCFCITLVSIVLVYAVAELSYQIEKTLSYVEPKHKQVLEAYRIELEGLVAKGHLKAVRKMLTDIQKKEGTFATIIEVSTRELVALEHTDYRQVEIKLGRSLEHPIHLYHDNPFIELPLTDQQYTFVIRLPDHMMPGQFWPEVHMMLHLFLPLVLMVVVSYALYRYLMRPLGKLERATRQFSQGNYEARVSPQLNGRNDELGRLANTFDEMAGRVGNLVKTQRHLIHDLSHELRTPLQRLELCLETEEPRQKQRLKKEADQMRKLVEDTLTLAWLENESPELRHENVDLVGLLEVIAEDTEFEYPDRKLRLELPEELDVANSSEKALNMALENIIRNAMRHTPVGGLVTVKVEVDGSYCQVCILDQGEGVPEELLDMIFKPFFRVDKARKRGQAGFGLGLALAKRQINGIGGSISARNHSDTGLMMSITIPLHS